MSIHVERNPTHTVITSRLHCTGLMAKDCSSAQYWDSLLKSCLPCHLICKQQVIVSRCNKFCVISQCNELAEHYYDGLLKRCVRCPEVCRCQNSTCPRNCLKTTTAAAAGRITTKSVQTLPPAGLSSHSTVDPNILLYSLWALSLVLVLTSLGLALRVILREAKTRSTKTGFKGAQDVLNKDLGIPLEEMQPRCGPSDSSIPTENCVCVHCFPDLKSLGQDCPIRAARSNKQAELQRAQHAEAGWANMDIYTSGSNALHVGAVVCPDSFSAS